MYRYLLPTLLSFCSLTHAMHITESFRVAQSQNGFFSSICGDANDANDVAVLYRETGEQGDDRRILFTNLHSRKNQQNQQDLPNQSAPPSFFERWFSSGSSSSSSLFSKEDRWVTQPLVALPDNVFPKDVYWDKNSNKVFCRWGYYNSNAVSIVQYTLMDANTQAKEAPSVITIDESSRNDMYHPKSSSIRDVYYIEGEVVAVVKNDLDLGISLLTYPAMATVYTHSVLFPFVANPLVEVIRSEQGDCLLAICHNQANKTIECCWYQDKVWSRIEPICSMGSSESLYKTGGRVDSKECATLVLECQHTGTAHVVTKKEGKWALSPYSIQLEKQRDRQYDVDARGNVAMGWIAADQSIHFVYKPYDKDWRVLPGTPQMAKKNNHLCFRSDTEGNIVAVWDGGHYIWGAVWSPDMDQWVSEDYFDKYCLFPHLVLTGNRRGVIAWHDVRDKKLVLSEIQY